MALTDAQLQELISLGATDEEILALDAEEAPKPKVDQNSPQFKQKVFEQTMRDRETYSPLSGQNALERGLIGAGKSVADTGSGIRQLWNRATGDSEELARLQGETAEQRELDRPLMDDTAGTVGNVVGHIAQAAVPGTQAAKLYTTAKMGLPAVAGIEALIGGAQGAVVPTAKEGELAENVGKSATISGAIPLAGTALRGLVGKVDPARQAAAQRLRDLGIDVSKVQEMPGLIADATGAALRRMPIVGSSMVENDKLQQELARKALFNMMGEAVPSTSSELADMTGRMGARVGASVPPRQVLPVTGLADDISAIMAREVDPSADVTRAAKELSQRATSVQAEAPAATLDDMLAGRTPTAPAPKAPTMTGEEYAQLRSSIGADIAGAKGRDRIALKQIQKALDAATERGMSPAQLAEAADARSKYHLIKALDKQVIDPAKGFDMKAAHRQLMKAGQKSRFPREVMQLLDDVALTIPQKGASSDTVRGVMTGLAVTNPLVAGGIAAATGIPHSILQTGVPQLLANNQRVRTATAAALRGKTQSELNEE